MRKNLVLTEGAPHRLASGGIQHGLFAGNADLELHRLHLRPVELGQRGEGQRMGKHYRQTKGEFPRAAILAVA